MFIRFLHIILAGQLFLGTVGVMVNFHLCNDKVESWAIYIQAESCHDEKSMNEDCSMNGCSDHENDEKNGCCDDETEITKLKLPLFEESSPSFKVNLLSGFSGVVFADQPRDLTNFSSKYINYKPPLISFNRPVLFQVFLF